MNYKRLVLGLHAWPDNLINWYSICFIGIRSTGYWIKELNILKILSQSNCFYMIFPIAFCECLLLVLSLFQIFVEIWCLALEYIANKVIKYLTQTILSAQARKNEKFVDKNFQILTSKISIFRANCQFLLVLHSKQLTQGGGISFL